MEDYFMKDEKQFETKMATAVTLFAMQFQNIMEGSADALGEIISKKYEANPDMSIEEMTKEVVKHVVSELTKEFKLQEVQNETRS